MPRVFGTLEFSYNLDISVIDFLPSAIIYFVCVTQDEYDSQPSTTYTTCKYLNLAKRMSFQTIYAIEAPN